MTKKITLVEVITTVVDVETGAVHKESSSRTVTEYRQLAEKQSAEFAGIQCEGWQCLPGDECPEKPRCPFGSSVHFEAMEGRCAKYGCVPAAPSERECRVNGPLITTFDGSHYSYDVCDHVLAQDRFKIWTVRSTYSTSMYERHCLHVGRHPGPYSFIVSIYVRIRIVRLS